MLIFKESLKKHFINLNKIFILLCSKSGAAAKKKDDVVEKKSIQNLFKRVFNLKTNIEEFTSKKINAFNQLQNDFSRSN